MQLLDVSSLQKYQHLLKILLMETYFISIEDVQGSLFPRPGTLPLLFPSIFWSQKEMKYVILTRGALLYHGNSIWLVESGKIEEVWLLVELVEYSS